MSLSCSDRALKSSAAWRKSFAKIARGDGGGFPLINVQPSGSSSLKVKGPGLNLREDQQYLCRTMPLQLVNMDCLYPAVWSSSCKSDGCAGTTFSEKVKMRALWILLNRKCRPE